MRKFNIILFILLILILSYSSTMADDMSNGFTVSMNGRAYSVKEIPIVLDGQAVFTDIPTFIHPINDYTLVPIRFIAERYGADVSWEQSTKTAIVNHRNNEIRITIDSNYIYINNQKKDIEGETLPKLVTFPNKDSRTMVPLRLVSESLGFEVGWDDLNRVPFISTENNGSENQNKDTGEIVDISMISGSTNSAKVKIVGNKRLDYSTSLMEDPDKLIIDIEKSVLNIKSNILFENGIGRIEVNQEPVRNIDISQFSRNPDIVRVVINLSKNADYEIISTDDGKTLTINFVNRIRKLEKEIIDGREALVIYNSEIPEVKTFKLSMPERIVLDFLDSTLQGESHLSYNYKFGFIDGVRVSQFAPDQLYKPDDRIVRVVLDVKDGILNPEVRIIDDGNRIIVIPETNLGEIIDYDIEGNSRIITINANKKTDYDIEYHRDDNLMDIIVPSDVLELEEGYLDIRDGLIDDIDIRKERGHSKIQIRFRRGVDYNVLSRDRDSNIILEFIRTENIRPSDRIIVIDPGHGGSDPGTVQNGYKEKDVNLPISLKLNHRLMDLGYNPIMTRYDDSYINLYDRVGLANDYQADLFISLHANSIANRDITGIQVLYYPKDKPMVPKEHTLALARIMMDELTRGTGAQDKGLLDKQNIVVVRETSMPSVLLELGFLTNPEEAKLLNDEIYQNILVDCIIKGIEKYFDLY